ncbi:hypothetical protein [Cohnella fermenti]|uniref:Uncharacterized protein n=1 Tax=Cohnella fermenti TaxID=2565925 RepID=A0A4S4BG87_9BACL|nr:hypothetical protein [Cohnella fermenti]THF73414.1 hypothetical protein E6C55_29410 [Cohnella fermenti]
MRIKFYIWKKALMGVLLLGAAAISLVGLAWAQDNEGKDDPLSHLERRSIEISDPTAGKKDPIIEEIKAKAEANRKSRLHQKDQFNYTKEDLEELFEAGASIEDIYRSDQLGNEWLTDPKSLIEEKRSQNKSWASVEGDIKKQKETELAVLGKKHSKAQAAFKNQKISTAEKIEILQTLEEQGDTSLDQALSTYQTKGLKGLESMKRQGGERQ